MKKLIILSIVLVGTMSSCSNQVTSGNKSLNSEKDSLSNAIGLMMGNQLKSTEDVDIDKNMVYNAMEKIMNASESELDSMEKYELKEAREFFRNYMTVTVPKKKAEASESFLEGISKEEGVKKTESGLYYKIVNMGDENVKALCETDTVKVNYVGTTIDGKEFDSSIKRGTPATFSLNRVIKGWTEGVQLVGKGGKIILYIPSELGYGSRGRLGNQTLIFDIDLLDVMPSVENK
ncbi:MAG: FKBP-type peptidyl-prolyl cis-trans isomerase [Bacteroidetes bacterium]|nr:FKBP-type peptidyl-prolyl cis-trans isomerase [Bacteroidota bacterium]